MVTTLLFTSNTSSISNTDADVMILGIHMRGTDKSTQRRTVIPQEYFPYILAFLSHSDNNNNNNNNNNKEKKRLIFLASDTSLYVNVTEKFLQSLGYSNKLIQLNIVRSHSLQPLFMQYPTHQSNVDVLTDIYYLSKCDYLLHSASAVSESAIYMNPLLASHSVHLEYTINRQNIDHIGIVAETHRKSLNFKDKIWEEMKIEKKKLNVPSQKTQKILLDVVSRTTISDKMNVVIN